MTATQTIDFATIRDFTFDRRSGRYKWTSGAGKNQFASKTAVLNRTRSLIVDRSNELVGLADRLASGERSLLEFQRDAAEILRDLHVLQAGISVGFENLFANDYARIGRELRQQYTIGRGENGDRFGVKWLADDIAKGKVSEAQLKARLKAFAASSKKSYWQALQAKNEGRFGFRVLAGSDRSCPDCVAYAAEGIKPVSELKLPAHNCQCRNNCRCTLSIYKTLKQAIESKG